MGERAPEANSDMRKLLLGIVGTVAAVAVVSFVSFVIQQMNRNAVQDVSITHQMAKDENVQLKIELEKARAVNAQNELQRAMNDRVVGAVSASESRITESFTEAISETERRLSVKIQSNTDEIKKIQERSP